MRLPSRWPLALAVLGLLIVGAVWRHPLPTQATDAAPLPSAPLTLLWTLRVNVFHGVALSPQGELVALSSGSKGAVSLWHWRTQPDRPLWVHGATNASSVAVSAAGSSVLAWSALDPDQRTLTILRGTDGATLSHRTLDGAIWDAEVSADGAYAGVVTGGKSLYLYALSEDPYTREDRRIHQWSLGGIGNSVAFPTVGSFLVTGSWDDSSVACYTTGGVCLWQYPEDPAARHKLADRLFSAQISGNGNYVLGVSCSNVRESDPTLYLWRTDGGGNPLWKTALGDDAFYPTAQITPDGRYIAVSYLRQIVRGEQSLSEHRLRVLERDGTLRWERGGLLFSPTLVALSPGGEHILVSDGQRTLYVLGKDGGILQSYPLPGTVRQTVISADGQVLLLYTGDGTLSLYRLG